MYRGGRPNRLAAVLNRATATVASAGLWPELFVQELCRQDRWRRLNQFQVVVFHLQPVATEDEKTSTLAEKTLNFCDRGVGQRRDITQDDYLIGI